VVLRLQPRPFLLEALTVAGAGRRLCPNREEPAARALWERMRARYWQLGQDSVFVHGFMEIRTGVGEKADAARPEAGRIRPGWTTGSLVSAHPELMALSGYGTPANGGPGERIAFWRYRVLDKGTLQDFTGAYFGAAHTFSLVATDRGEPTLAFCPRERRRDVAQIEGLLRLRADTTLAWARWSFRTPRPDEDAGGEASYYPPDPGFDHALLAHETQFWRRTGRDRYYFEAHTFTGWTRRSR
jgi:hypothetical protein